MAQDTLRDAVQWHPEYRPEWDGDPDEYLTGGVVGWGRSRRLGLWRLGRLKAYLGVQHVDPDRPGWRIVEEPSARFFLSLFIDGQCVTLRTFPTVGAAVDALAAFRQTLQM